MNRRLLILIITLIIYSGMAAAQTSPAAAGNNPATDAARTPAASTGVQSVVKKDEDCGCGVPVLPDVLAIVNGIKVTGKDIAPQVTQRVSTLQQQVVEARKRELDLQINSRLLDAEAKKRGVSTVKLLEDEVIAKVKEPTAAEVQAFYDENKTRIGAELKDVRGDIIAYLRSKRERDEAGKLAERMRAAAQIKILIPDAPPPVSAADRARVLATVNGERITSEDIEDSLRPIIYNVQEQAYRLRQREIDLRINDALLEQEAQKRKMTTSALLDAEVAAKIKPVTEAEARTFYEKNRERLNGDDFMKVRDQIMQYLQEQQMRDVQLAFAEQLRRAATIQTFLVRPEPPVYNIATDNQPSQGSATAPVTIIEFTDYQCPSCAAAQPSIERLMKEYEGKVRLVVRDFPLESHVDAFKAAEAAEAAREQGKYWEYVSLLMRNQTKLDAAALKEYASRTALDRQKFDAALDSGKYVEAVQRDMRDGVRAGVNGTPTVFVNGRRVNDATYETLKAAIETALKATATK